MSRLRMIDDWRRWHRFWSTRLNIIGSTLIAIYMTWPGVVLEVWNFLPSELKELMPPRLMLGLALIFFLAATGARVIKQKSRGE